jgi:hypothetical protein
MRRLYAEVHATAERRLRRWKWAASFIVAAAAGLAFLVLATRTELRVEGHQLVLRWGTPPSIAEESPQLRPEAPAVALEQADQRSDRSVEDQIRVLSKIVHTMARDSSSRGDDFERDLEALQRRLIDLQRQIDRRFFDTEKDLRTLYKWQFVRNDKREIQ